MIKKAVQFFQEAKVELMNVNWPTRKQIIGYTALVVAVSIAVALFLGGLDFGFSYILKTYIIK
ncbi:MAG: preprotein translocase subunit SecE [Candidatus Moranbacteria bacterium]|nr:preprotein translocase subunit SecE [Candidatus Moranbacteria bacterium]